MDKYITIVVRVVDEPAARAFVPGVMLGSNMVVACGLGHALDHAEKVKELVPEEKDDELAELERENIAPFVPWAK